MRALYERVRDSVFRVGWPADDRAALKAMLSSFVLHVHAPKVRPATLRFTATWALGLVSLVLALSLVATGALLMLYYVPHPDAAYRSMKDLAFVVPFGVLTRNGHRWAAHAMVALVVLHMVRVFLSGGYKAPREANWVAGVLLLLLTLALSFTGYLLPWDQLAFWAVTVGARMVASIPVVGEALARVLLGDAVVGEAALLRFYVLHCVVLPLALFGLVGFHLFRVRKDGGLVTSEHAPADAELPRLIPSWPHLVHREAAIALATCALLLLASFAFDAPLEPEADPGRTPNPAKAPWYFLGIQELAHHSAFWGGVFVPFVAVLALAALPYFDRGEEALGRYFPKERWRACTIFSLAFAFFAVATVIGTFFRGPAWSFGWYAP